MPTAPISRRWARCGARFLPQTGFVGEGVPDAPFATPIGRQWFDNDGVTHENRPGRVAAAREPFDRLLREIIAARGLGDRLDRVALVGFSQGAIMALDALASGRWAFGAVVAFSGRLASPPPLAPSLATPALLIHGDDNSVIPESESREAAAALQKLGVKTRLHILHGVEPFVCRKRLSSLAQDFFASN